jgi:hypothetical protein
MTRDAIRLIKERRKEDTTAEERKLVKQFQKVYGFK